VIGRVLKKKNVREVLRYLYGPGKAIPHVSPHLVVGWREPSELEPPLHSDGQRSFRFLAGQMEVPLVIIGSEAPAAPVWHCVIRAAPEDPVLEDGAWRAIAEEVIERTGLSERGRYAHGVPWVAIRNADDQVHIVAVLIRLDLRRPRLSFDYYRVGEAMRWAERTHKLRRLTARVRNKS
jgi:hypothetical protein